MPPTKSGAATEMERLADELGARELEMRRTGRADVERSVCEDLTRRLFRLVDEIELQVRNGALEMASARQEFDRILTPSLCRSPLYWRSRFKPHGYAGDFRIIEDMYDLEESLGQSATQPAFLNALAYSFSQVHSVQGLWQRRRLIAELVHKNTRRPLRILDFACGGARYLVDALGGAAGEGVDVLLVDQDPAALNFAKARLEAKTACRLATSCAPIKHVLRDRISGTFDLIVSAGLFDYLEQDLAAALASMLLKSLDAGGVLCITNFGSGDKSAFFKALVVDWPLIHRSEADLRALIPSGVEASVSTSRDGSLTYCLARQA